MKAIKKQQDKVEILFDLIKENPDLEILPMVDTECVCDDSHGYWMANWGRARIDEYYCSDERVYFRENEFEDLVEDFMDRYYEDYSNLSDEEFEKLAEEKVNGYEWVKAIIIYIEAL